MTTNCSTDSCEWCNKCDGYGECWKANINGMRTKHKCEFNCQMAKCLRCDMDIPTWFYQLKSGFCTICYQEMATLYKENKSKPGVLNQTDFVKKMANVYL